MKKFLIIILIPFLTSCLATKRLLNKETVSTEITETKKDSLSNLTVSKKISDEARIKIPQSNTGNVDIDKRVNDAVVKILRSINFQKTSGDNSYKLYYDEKLEELRALINVGETKNLEVKTIEENSTEKTFEEQVDEYIKKTVVPWWFYLIMGFLFWPRIISIISLVFPNIKNIKFLNST